MNVERYKDLSVIDLIEPHFTFGDPRLKKLFVEDLIKTMVHAPESIQVLAAIEEAQLKAFTITQDPGSSVPYLYLAQAWSLPGNPLDWNSLFFARIVVWAVALGKDYVRSDTRRDAEPFYRRYGFEPYMQMMKFDLKKRGIHEEVLKWASSTQKLVHTTE